MIMHCIIFFSPQKHLCINKSRHLVDKALDTSGPTVHDSIGYISPIGSRVRNFHICPTGEAQSDYSGLFMVTEKCHQNLILAIAKIVVRVKL